MLAFFVLGALSGGLTMTILMACLYASKREEKDGKAQGRK